MSERIYRSSLFGLVTGLPVLILMVLSGLAVSCFGDDPGVCTCVDTCVLGHYNS